MAKLKLKRTKPSLVGIVRLRCSYCLQSPLLKEKSWFEFREGCPICQYRYDREPGYFWGAPWMINYPLTGIFTLALLYLIYQSPWTIPVLWIATIVSISGSTVAILLYPFARAIWMVADHRLHPLTESDYLGHAGESNQ